MTETLTQRLRVCHGCGTTTGLLYWFEALVWCGRGGSCLAAAELEVAA